MTNPIFLNIFLNIHILVIAGSGIGYLMRVLNHKKLLNLSAGNELQLNHMLVISVFVLPLVFAINSNQLKFAPMTKTYFAETYREFDLMKSKPGGEKLIVGKEELHRSLDLHMLQLGILLLILTSAAVSVLRLLRELRGLNLILQNSMIARSLRGVHISFSNQICVPFSVRTLRKAWVVLPYEFLADASKTRISILHEIQHHRQRDTLWQYAFLTLKAVAGMNPAVNGWLKIISEVQELKVDEVLIDQKKVKPQDYARCLIEVAESVVRGERQLVGATSLAFLPERQQLKRRIESMFKKKITSKVKMLTVSVCLLSSMTALALTTSRVVGSGRVTMPEAQKMASIAQKDTEFPIVVNDLVLEQLNRFVGTAQGREYMRASIARMKNYQPAIERKLQEYNLPSEFLAVPIIESGYRNSLPSSNEHHPAGLWQFTDWTAMGYGLMVWGDVDERMDVEKETDAAMRLLLANKIRFKKWELSVLAYNAGEKMVSKGILKTKSYDAWTLIRNGYEGDKGYLPKLMAAILIMKNPDIIE